MSEEYAARLLRIVATGASGLRDDELNDDDAVQGDAAENETAKAKIRFSPSTLDEPITDVAINVIRYASVGRHGQVAENSDLHLSGPLVNRVVGVRDQLVTWVRSYDPAARVSVMSQNDNLVADYLYFLSLGPLDPIGKTASVEDTAREAASAVGRQVLRATQSTTFGSAKDIQRSLKSTPTALETSYKISYVQLQRLVWTAQRIAAQGLTTPVAVELLRTTARTMSKMVFVVCGDLTAVFCPRQNVWMIGPLSVTMNFHNLTHVRWATLVSNRVIGALPESVLESVFNWQHLVIDGGNSCYEAVKMVESVARTAISRAADPQVEWCGRPYTRMLRKLRERCLEKFDTGRIGIWFHRSAQDFAERVTRDLDRIFDGLTVRCTTEVFGLQKTIGFPVVNVKAGGRKVHDGASGSGHATWLSTLRSEWIFCHLVLKNHIQRTGKWPVLSFVDWKTDLRLRDVYKSKPKLIDDSFYDLSDWAYTSFPKMYEFDPYPDMTPFVVDKACSPGFDEAKKMYYASGGLTPSKRRVVTSVLKRPDLTSDRVLEDWKNDTYDIERERGGTQAARIDRRILRLTAHEPSPAERPLVVLKPKEKEFKVAPRMYCLLPPEHRFPLGILQENVKRGVFSDLPYSTMNLGSVDQSLQLWDMADVADVVVDGVVMAKLFIEVDYSAWNNKFRDSLISRYGARLDQMYGVENMFGKIHKYFSSCHVAVVVDGLRVPSLEGREPDNETCWTDHEGGIEGIDQATWTAATISMVYEAIGFTGYSFRLIGQGDNQVLAVDLPVPKDDWVGINSHAQKIMTRINQSALFLNHDAKPDEFVESASTMTYSKKVYSNGAVYPTQLKFSGKIGPFPQADRASELEIVGALSSSARAAAETMWDPIYGYLCYLELAPVVLACLAESSPSLSPAIGPWLKHAGPKEIECLLTIPSVLGGAPIVGVTGFLISGEPDSLGAAIGSLRFLRKGGSTVIDRWLTLADRDDFWRKDTASGDALLDDPESIPIQRLAGGERIVEDRAIATVKSCVRNPDYQELCSNWSEQEETKVRSAVMSMDPLFPHIASDLLALSYPGVMRKLVKKFAGSRTISGETRAGSDTNAKAAVADSRAVRSTLTIVTLVSIAKGPCSWLTSTGSIQATTFQICESLRKRWGRSVAGLSTANPVDYDTSINPRDTGFKVFSYKQITDLAARGSLPLFLGSSTDDRVVDKIWDVKPTAGIDDLKKLVVVSSSPGMAGARPLVERIIQSRGVVSIGHAERVLPTVVGGSVAHRYVGLNREMRSGPTGNENLSSFLEYNSDCIDGFSGSKIDWPVSVAYFYSYLNWLARRRLREGSETPTIIVKFDCSGLEPLAAIPVTLTKQPDFKRTTPKSPLLKIALPEVARSTGRRVLFQTVEAARLPSHVLVAAILMDRGLERTGETRSELQSNIKKATPGPHGLGVAELAGLTSADVLDALVLATTHLALFEATDPEDFVKPESPSKDYDVIFRALTFSVAKRLVSEIEPVLQCESLEIRQLAGLRYDPRASGFDTSFLTMKVASRALASLRGTESDANPVVPLTTGLDSCTGSAILSRVLPPFMLGHVKLSNGAVSTRQLIRRTAAIRGFFEITHDTHDGAPFDERKVGPLLAAVVKSACLNPNHPNPELARELMELIDGVSRKVRVISDDRRTAVRVLRSRVLNGTGLGRAPLQTTRFPVSIRSGGTDLCRVVDTGHAQPAELLPTSISVRTPFLASTIDDSSPDDRERAVIHKTLRKVGCYSGFASGTLELTIASLSKLIGTLNPVGSAAVVGTGQGGVQTALAGLGICSSGYDLRSAISPSVLHGVSPSPPEPRNCGFNLAAVYAEDPVVDWRRPESVKVGRVLLSNVGLIIIDIESGSRRWLDDALAPMFCWTPVAGQRGKVIVVKYIVDAKELETVVTGLAWHQGREEISNLTVQVNGGCCCDGHKSHVWVAFNWDRKLTVRHGTTRLVQVPLPGSVLVTAEIQTTNPTVEMRLIRAATGDQGVLSALGRIERGSRSEWFASVALALSTIGSRPGRGRPNALIKTVTAIGAILSSEVSYESAVAQLIDHIAAADPAARRKLLLIGPALLSFVADTRQTAPCMVLQRSNRNRLRSTP